MGGIFQCQCSGLSPLYLHLQFCFILYSFSLAAAVSLSIVEVETGSTHAVTDFHGQLIFPNDTLFIQIDPTPSGYNPSELLFMPQDLNTTVSPLVIKSLEAQNGLEVNANLRLQFTIPPEVSGFYFVVLNDFGTGERLATSDEITAIDQRHLNNDVKLNATTQPIPTSVLQIIPSTFPSASNTAAAETISALARAVTNTDSPSKCQNVLMIALLGSLCGLVVIMIVIATVIYFRRTHRHKRNLEPLKPRGVFGKLVNMFTPTAVIAQPYYVIPASLPSPSFGVPQNKNRELSSAPSPAFVQHDQVNALTEVIALLQDRISCVEETQDLAIARPGEGVVNAPSGVARRMTDKPPPEYPNSAV